MNRNWLSLKDHREKLWFLFGKDKNLPLVREKGYRPYSKSSLTLIFNECKFNLSFSWGSTLFLNSWRCSVISYYVTAHPPAIQKHHWHAREAQIEPPLIECEWAFRIQAYVNPWSVNTLSLTRKIVCPQTVNLKSIAHLVALPLGEHIVHGQIVW
jgi:hypothetical protein